METLMHLDQVRLAKIRADNERWRALRPDAEGWEQTFLLGIIDKLLVEVKK